MVNFISKPAQNCATRMQTLINNLLKYARTNSITIITDMNTALEHTHKNLYETINESNANIVGEILPTLSINPSYTIRLLQNFMIN